MSRFEPRRGPRRPTILVLPLVWAALLAAAAPTAAYDFADLDGIPFRYIGPIGNRVSAVVGVPGTPNRYLIGAASGGIWLTDDGGLSWRPVFDDHDVSSVGALAVAPSDANVVYAGTGETWIRSNISVGRGLFRSVDGGQSFQPRGLEGTGRIGRILVDPRDPDTVLVAALGHGYGPQPERGVFRSEDGGASWSRTLFVDDNTGAIDLAFHPTNPRIVYAAFWQIQITTSGRTSGGPGSGLHVSRDGGRSWRAIEHDGLPPKPWGKIGLAVSADRPDRLYALIETSSNSDFAPSEPFAGSLWRSDDQGDSWSLVSRSLDLIGRPLYYTRMVASPDDADELTFLGPSQWESVDGGKTIERNNSGWDHHDLWIDPLDSNRRIVGHDGGVSISTNGGVSWLKPQLPIAQVYHVSTDNRVPYFVYGNRQDGPSLRGPSRVQHGFEIPVAEWHSIGGCEVGFAYADPHDSDLVWSGCYDGQLDLHNLETGQSRDVSVWPMNPESWAAADLRYRIQWTAPLAVSRHTPETAYYGSQYVHRTRNRGQSWEVISPDLTTADPELMRRTGGLTLDDAGPTIGAVLFAITESEHDPNTIWTGSNDGLLHVTRDGGEGWTDLTDRLPRLPPRGTISNIEVSPHDPDKIFVTVDRHQENDSAAYVFRSTDGGRNWRSIAGGLETSPLGYAHCLREDPDQPGLLYLGTGNGLWISPDDGERWRRLSQRSDSSPRLPPAPVHWIEVQEHFGDLVVSTYGRGIWILDDLTPLRAWARSSGEAAPTSPRLLEVRDAYRFRQTAAPMGQPEVPAAGSNPPPGVALHYFVPGEHEGVLTLEVVAESGQLVRRWEDLDGPGLKRVHWDLSWQLTSEGKIYSRPAERPDFPMPPRGWRSLPDRHRFRQVVRPGTYRARLVEKGEVVRGTEKSFDVLTDPASTLSGPELELQSGFLTRVRAAVEEATSLVNTLEETRRQLREVVDRLAEPETESLQSEVQELESALADLESRFFDLRLTGTGQDTLRWQRRLSARLVSLASAAQRSDHPPTEQHLEVFETLRQELDLARSDSMPLLGERIDELNDRLRQANLGDIF